MAWDRLVWVGVWFVCLFGCQGNTVTQEVDDVQAPTLKQVARQNVVVDPGPESFWTRKSGNDWPVFMGPTGDGQSTETGILKDWTDGKLNVVWTADTGEGYGMGTVAKGRFYHFGKFGDHATLQCRHAETGELIWEFGYLSEYQDLFQYDSGPRASPVIDEDLVYIYGVEGMLHCLEANTGKEIWKLDTVKRFGVIQNFFGVASTPVIFGDTLIVMVGGSPRESQKVPPGQLNLVKSNGTGLIGLDKRTGDIKFQCVDDLGSYCSLKLATFQDAPVVLAWMRDSLFGVNPESGEVQFEFPWRARVLESVNASMPVIKGTQVLISECYGKGAVVLELAEMSKPVSVWNDEGRRDKSLEAHWNTPIVVGDFVYGCSGRHTAQAELRCVEWKTGKVCWAEPGLSRSSLTSIDGHFIVVGEQGQLLLIKANPEKFEEVTRYNGGEGDNVKFVSPCWAAPVVSHGLLYVRGKNKLVCFDLIPEK